MLRLVLGLGIATALAGPVAADKLVMPFSCEIADGRLVVEPSAERTYLILGPRAARPFTVCMTAGTSDCRTLMVHRFDLSCRGGRASWVEIAARLPGRLAEQAWIDKGRLNLMLVSDPGSATPESCSGAATRLARFGAPSHVLPPQASSQGCRRQVSETRRQTVVLPAGFAPLAEYGGRLLLADGSSLEAEAERMVPQAEFTVEPRRLSDRVVVAETLPPLETGALMQVAAVDGAAWTTTVIRADTASGGGLTLELLAALLSATLLTAAGGWLTWRRGLAIPAVIKRGIPIGPWHTALVGVVRRARSARGAPDEMGEESLANAAEGVEALLGQCEAAVDRLSGAGALQDVLRNELKGLRQRLAGLKASVAGDGDERVRRAGPLFRVMIREIERIRRIADGAALSLAPAARDTSAVPRTVSEAYDVLGVNPNVTDVVLKKVVDALRMSWHPDHAGDEQDRLAREERIKQINIAWELIAGKRRPS